MGLTTSCQSEYDPPTFQTIFDKTLKPTCAAGNGTCHDPLGAMKGLILDDADTAYSLLLSPPDTSPRVLPGNPACSLLVIRLSSSDPNFRMPPGPTPLLPGEICAVVQWIAQGAAR
jgi:hypothetical protein